MLPNSHETELSLDNTGSLNSASTLSINDDEKPVQSSRLKSEIRVWRKGEILDSYRILDTLGEGSSSVVYRVIEAHKTLGRKVCALKYLRRRNDRARARFAGEVKALNELAGLAGIPDLYLSELDREDPYFLMESIEGQTLSHLKGSRDSWAAQSALSLVTELGRIVSRLHMRGYIHRDLKPSNVIVRDKDSALFLIDFGLARGPDGDSFKARGPLGTPYYMSPEQTRLLNRELSPASDVWALGVILYELTVGRRPFLAKNPFHLMQKIARDRPRR
ncbi:MAG: serine/threonine-protein kinase, partial [Planctomycetota bacterium]|nr:serine/threonine-protein kinase [Planctomycetota bacterium]